MIRNRGKMLIIPQWVTGMSWVITLSSPKVQTAQSLARWLCRFQKPILYLNGINLFYFFDNNFQLLRSAVTAAIPGNFTQLQKI